MKQAEGGRRNGTVFTFFIQEFRSVMDNPAASSKDVSTAIRGYGYFAAVSTFSTSLLYPRIVRANDISITLKSQSCNCFWLKLLYYYFCR